MSSLSLFLLFYKLIDFYFFNVYDKLYSLFVNIQTVQNVVIGRLLELFFVSY